MDARTRARQGHRLAGVLVALGLALGLVGVLALTLPRITGRFVPAPQAPGNTLLTSTPEQIAAARTQLAALAVIPRPAISKDYRRAAFGDAWTDTDGNGCNQRDDVLLRDVLKSQPYRVGQQRGCDHDVLSWSWLDPYVGDTVTLTDAKAQGQLVQIDHIVALSVAWRYGARAWTDARRLAFANDLRDLLAVGGDTNEKNSGSDASQWHPTRGAQCGFAVRYVTVKAAYALPTDQAEQQSLRAMLDTCG